MKPICFLLGRKVTKFNQWLLSNYAHNENELIKKNYFLLLTSHSIALEMALSFQLEITHISFSLQELIANALFMMRQRMCYLDNKDD